MLLGQGSAKWGVGREKMGAQLGHVATEGPTVARGSGPTPSLEKQLFQLSHVTCPPKALCRVLERSEVGTIQATQTKQAWSGSAATNGMDLAVPERPWASVFFYVN